MSLDSGLKISSGKEMVTLTYTNIHDALIACTDNLFIIVARPLSDLTKPIVQANYNGGKPFVPIVELAKICFQNSNIVQNGIYAEFRHFWLKFENGNFCSNGAVNNQLQLFLKLIEWHFNLMDESEQFIDVNTLPENPYK